MNTKPGRTPFSDFAKLVEPVLVFSSEMTEGVPEEWPFDKIPAGRPGSYDEITSTILWLVGRGGAYANGQVLVIEWWHIVTNAGHALKVSGCRAKI